MSERKRSIGAGLARAGLWGLLAAVALGTGTASAQRDIGVVKQGAPPVMESSA